MFRATAWAIWIGLATTAASQANDVGDLEQRALAAFHADQHDEAARLVEEWLSHGETADAHALLFRIRFAQGDRAAALVALERAADAGLASSPPGRAPRDLELLLGLRGEPRFARALAKIAENHRAKERDDPLRAQRLDEKRAALDRVERLLLESRVLWLDGHAGIVNSVGWSADGRRLVTTCSDDDTVRLWDSFTGEAIAVLGRHDRPTATFDPTGERVLVFDESTERASLWDGRTGQLLGWLPDELAVLTHARFAGDAPLVVAVDETGRVSTFDLDGLPVESFELGGFALDMAVAPDGDALIALTHDGVISSISLASGDRTPIVSPDHPVASIHLGPRGRFLVSTSHDGKLALHDLEQPDAEPTDAGFTLFSRIAFTPDGERLVAFPDPDAAAVWSTHDATHTTTLDPGAKIHGFDLSADGARIAVLCFHPPTADGTPPARPFAIVWDVATGDEVCRLSDADSPDGQRKLIYPREIRFLKDGRRIATTEGDAYSVALWDATTGAWLGQGIHTLGSIMDLSESPVDDRVAYASYSRFAGVYRFTSQLNAPLLCGGVGHSLTMSVDPATGLIAAGGAKWPPPYRLLTCVFDPSTGATVGDPIPARAHTFLPDGSGDLITNANDERTGFRRYATPGDEVWNHPAPGTFVGSIPSTDGSRVLAHHWNALLLLDASTGATVRAFDEIHHGFDLIRANLGAVSPDGDQVVFSRRAPPGAFAWWDETSDVTATVTGHRRNVRRFAFDRTGDRLVTASADGTARIWDAATRETLHVLTGHDDMIWDACFAFDDGDVLTCSADATVRRWDASSGEALATYPCGPGELVWSIAVHEESGRLAAAGTSGVIRVFDVDAPEAAPRVLEGHTAAVQQLAFDDDGARIYSAGADLSLRVWDVEAESLLVTHVQYDDGDFVRYTPEGYFIGTPRGADIARVVVESRLERGVWPLSSYARILGDAEKVAAKLRGDRMRAPVLPPAPTIDILSPVTGEVTSRGLTLEASAADRTGIGRITVWQDGRPLDDARVAQGVVSNSSNTSSTIKLTLEIPTHRPDTELVVRAENRRGILSVPRRVRVVYEPPAADLYLLAMGVADYDDDGLDLAYPVKDVDDLIARFEAERGTLYRDVHVHRLADDEVTGSNLRRARERFLHRAGEEDTIVVFAAGHGVRSETGEYYYLTPGATATDPYDGIERSQLESLVTWDRLLARRRLLLIDTCHSGEAYGEGARGAPAMTSAFQQDEVDTALGEGLYIFAASSEEGLAREQDGNGLFTRALLDGLDGAADASGDGLVDVAELMSYASQRVKDDSQQRQRPTMPRVVGGDPFGLARTRG